MDLQTGLWMLATDELAKAASKRAHGDRPRRWHGSLLAFRNRLWPAMPANQRFAVNAKELEA